MYEVRFPGSVGSDQHVGADDRAQLHIGQRTEPADMEALDVRVANLLRLGSLSIH